jgi:hypothetical protein
VRLLHQQISYQNFYFLHGGWPGTNVESWVKK